MTMSSIYVVYQNNGEDFYREDHLSVFLEDESVKDVFEKFHENAELITWFTDQNLARECVAMGIDCFKRAECLQKHWMEITAERFEYMLGVLPPRQWKQGGFFISELWSGDLGFFYQEKYINGVPRYFERIWSIKTPRPVILESLKNFVEKEAEIEH
ncbi:hypothetical protein AGMMS49944_04000 [Spirochaetia bacterium]|nr:hypothetical protein AGMMS49944_04000 [Spirochaetia bacterium]